jgi:O-succinylbenzoic acid--CoA ligase
MPTELRVEQPDDDGAGEILVRGPNVTPGYVNQPAALQDGWLHTGDLGRLDDEGYLYVLDRRSDLIVSGGENVYPAEVEAALLAHRAVRETGVVGVADEQWGQRVVAHVVVDEPVTGDELTAFLRARLAGYKVPREYRFVGALPRNAAGKLLRRDLRESGA